MSAIFAQLGTRIFGGLFLAALFVIGIQNAKIEGFRFGQFHVWKADFWLINYQGWKPRALAAEAANAAFPVKGKQIEADRAQSVDEGHRQQQAIREVVKTIIVPEPVQGCETPAYVMEALK